jgi:tripartite-type tricarboxylate transporter receptor subunit TctC
MIQAFIKVLRAALLGLVGLSGVALTAAPSADSYQVLDDWVCPGGRRSWRASWRSGCRIISAGNSSWKIAGSGGNIAAAAGINSPPDGYTLLFSGANNAISASLYKKLSFDFIRDTVPVAMFMQVPNMLVVSNAMPVKTVSELIDYCKANPGKISYASSGYGTSVHMSAELFKAMTKCDMVHVPYRGSAVAFPDIISNKVQLIFDNLPTALAQARAGNVRALGVTSAQRWPGLPDIPAIAETVPGFESTLFYAMSAPKGTPPEIVDILNKAVNEAMKDPKLVARFAELGGSPKPMTPAEFGKLIVDETEKWRKVVEFAGVSVD